MFYKSSRNTFCNYLFVLYCPYEGLCVDGVVISSKKVCPLREKQYIRVEYLVDFRIKKMLIFTVFKTVKK